MTSRDATGERPIQVGDLVMIVKNCCPRNISGHQAMGIPFRVERMHSPLVRCDGCGWGNITRVLKAYGNFQAPVEWLKRIPPLSELEGQRTEESTKEPA